MKTIKNTLLAFTAAALIMPVFNGCKKGENDPAISLKSRTSRITGEWKASKMEQTITSSSSVSGSYTTTTTSTFDGTSLTKEITSTQPGSTKTTVVDAVSAFTLAIEKDGTYKSVFTSIQTSVNGTPSTGQTASTQTDEGIWNFSGGAGDTKKKSELVLVTTKYTTATGAVTSTSTYEGNDNGDIFLIDQLKSKEMILKVKKTTVTPNWGTTGATDTDVEETTITYTQE